MTVCTVKATIVVTVAVVLMALVTASFAENWQEYKARTRALSASKRTKRNAQPDSSRTREKRTLAFPSSSVLAITPIFCIPLITDTNFTSKLYMELPFKITLPTSTSIATIGRVDDRLGIYTVIMDAMMKFGVNGKACLLKSICEVAETPIEGDGLLGEVVNILLSVSTGPQSNELDEFSSAEFYGRSYGDCSDMYSECPVSVLKLFE